MKWRFLPILIIMCVTSLFFRIDIIINSFIDAKSDSMSLLINKLNVVTNQALAEEHNTKTENTEKKEDNLIDPNVHTVKPTTLPLGGNCNQIEMDLLQTLSKRREKLDAWLEDAKNKENVLKAAEMKIDKKLEELKNLKKDVEALLASYNEKEDIKIDSLVKIYEAMKPKDVAPIFEHLEMTILLEVIDRMQEKKVAPILANVSPQRANQITIEFANQKKLGIVTK